MGADEGKDEQEGWVLTAKTRRAGIRHMLLGFLLLLLLLFTISLCSLSGR
jgi:hypothetical protein